MIVVVSLLLVMGCDRREEVASSASAAKAQATRRPATTTHADQLPRIVFLGDSLTAGYGLEGEQAFCALVGNMLREEGIDVHIVNAGVSGDTTAGGRSRLNWLIRQKPSVVVVGLGANDGLRGLDLSSSEQNLRAIVQQARDGGAEVLLLGMLIPPNYGPDYITSFRDIYPRIAKEMNVPLVPFVLEGVGGHPELNLPDGIHPTAQGHEIVARNVLPYLREIIRKRETTRAHP